MCLGRHVWLRLFLVAGCSSTESTYSIATTVEGCEEQFAASKGYGYAVDRGAVAAPSTAPGATNLGSSSALQRALLDCASGAADAPAGPASDPELVETEATDGGSAEVSRHTGTNCDFSRLMTHDAALCVASVRGLPEAEGYSATIVYRSKYRRIVWVVSNTQQLDGQAFGGELMTIDATTGQLLERKSW